ncbi:MAG: glycosyltransferase family 39 protein [Saccharofermentans sp.]|nr:glycosyltransferase family 39 protein [Saccharofermentans sp.]
MKMFYALAMQFDISAHDLWDISDWNTITAGTLGYVQYMFQYRQLPDFFDGQFYHPPLFFSLAALVFGPVYSLTKDEVLAFEVVQVANMIVAFLITVVAYKLFKELNIRGTRLVFANLFICFCPTLYNMGACINNDCLMTLFCALVLLYALKWAKTRRMVDIILSGLFLAFGMLTKVSAVLLAPGIGLLFLYVLITDKKNIKRNIIQYLVFAIVSIPLGISFAVRNYVKLGMPFNYIMPLDAEPFDVPLITRIGLPSIKQMTTCITDFSDHMGFTNIWGQTVQSMLFDEMLFNTSIEPLFYLSVALIWITYVVLIYLLIRFLVSLVKSKYSIENKILIYGCYFSLMVSYFVFCFSYKHICTMHMRYIFCTLILLWAGTFGSDDDSKKNVISKHEWLFYAFTALFSISSLVLYLIPIQFQFS